MSNSSSNPWHSTDDGDDVNVPINRRSTATPLRASSDDYSTMIRASYTDDSPSTEKRKMGLAALVGIGSVLIVTSLFVNTTDLFRGALTVANTESNTTTVNITAAGVFEPVAISVIAGQSITFNNQHKDPQVLKVTGENPLFDSLILFADQSMDVTIPLGTSGTFVYASETLPESSILTITVTPQRTSSTIEQTAVTGQSGTPSIPIPFAENRSSLSSSLMIPIPFAENTSSVASSIPIPFDGNSSSQISDIPIPFGENSSSSQPIVITPSSSTPSSNTNTTTVITTSNGSGGGGSRPVVLSVASAQGGGYTYVPPTLSMAQNDIPKNTYVGRSPSASVTKKAGLHAGAPLNQYRPRKIVETGMGTWMIALAGMLAIGMTMRMAKKSA